MIRHVLGQTAHNARFSPHFWVRVGDFAGLVHHSDRGGSASRSGTPGASPRPRSGGTAIIGQ